MRNRILIVLFAGLFLTNDVEGQDMHFTQFYASPLYLNPSFAGANVCSRLSLTYRNQWPGISKTYKSFLFSGDHYVSKYNLGAGILVGSDLAGSGDLRTTIIAPMISYGIKINRKLAMRAGFQPGFGIKSINYSNLIFGDQLARGGGVATIEDLPGTNVYLDIAAGGIIYSEVFWMGASGYHLTRDNVSLTGTDEHMPIKYSVHGGAKIAVNKGEHDSYLQRFISPALHYRGQREFDQFDIGFYFTQYVFNLGFWYRGIPGFKAYAPGYSNNDALSVIIGVQTDRMNIGYSYDRTWSLLYQSLSKGSHEITMSYQLCKLKKKSRRYLLIPCPKF